MVSNVKDLPRAIDYGPMDWIKLGACREAGRDSSWWYPKSVGDLQHAAVAMSVCRQCPVQAECLEHALNVPEVHGIWGGLMEKDRRMEVRRRAGANFYKRR